MANHHPLISVHMSKKKQKNFVDNLVNFAAFLAPLSVVPQIIDLFEGRGHVALVTWLCFMVFNGIFLLYGIYHKLRPIIVTNILWLLAEFLVVLETIFHTS